MAKVGFRNGVEYAAGITFDDAVNVLDDFNNWQSWVPVIEGGTTPGVGTYGGQTGSYMRIGNLVICSFNLQYSAHTGTGDMVLTNLPFVVDNSTGGSFNLGCLVSAPTFTYPAGVTGLTVQPQTGFARAFFSGYGDSTSVAAGFLQMQNVATTIRGVAIFTVSS